jgi:asparagine synthase (glutamine-hydrolysing)
MCGISGLATRRFGDVDLQATIESMAGAIRHRGPDGTDFRCFGPPTISQGVALGHNRLAIIDVSEDGQEPMTNEDGTVWLVFNGEIYNFQDLRARLEPRGHRFRSRTDAEVIIHLYEDMGPSCIKEMNGIFAFAILDLKRDLLLLARDPIGVKPLFYAATPDHFLFGSEIKAILAASLASPSVNWKAVSDFFTYLYVPGPETAFNGIRQVSPGHILTFRLRDNTFAIERYWDVSRRLGFERSSYDQLKSSIHESLAASVKRQLVSDVPIGVFLSGGIDSTIVTGLAKKEKRDIQTYTLGFTGEEFRFYNEAAESRSVSKHLGTEHFELSLDFPDALSILNLVEFDDQPFANPTSYLMHQLSVKAREHITVALCGAGGDELFAGYPRTSAIRLARRLGWAPLSFLQFGGVALGCLRDSYQTPYLRRARKFLAGLNSDFFVQYANWTYFMNEDLKHRLLLRASTEDNLHSSIETLRKAYAHSSLAEQDNRILEMDLSTFLVDNILDYTDRMSMATALEVRVPFLDPAFVEMSLNAPFSYKIRNGGPKSILVDAFSEFLRPEARGTPKRGFNAPLGQWFNRLFDPYFDASGPDSRPSQKRFGEDVGASWHDGILDFRFIQRLRNEHRRGRRDNSHELFACIIFDVWWRKYVKGTDPLVHWPANKERLCAFLT